MAAGYLGRALRNIDKVSDRWANPDTPLRTVAVECVGIAAALATAAGGAFMAWGILGSLPNISAAALDQWPDLLPGDRTLLYSSQLFETKHLTAGFLLVLGFARTLPSAGEGSTGADYRPLVKAAAYALSGYTVWLVATKLASLGHGYPLLGAAVAGGLFAAAAVTMVAASSPVPAGCSPTPPGGCPSPPFGRFSWGRRWSSTVCFYAPALRSSMARPGLRVAGGSGLRLRSN